MFRAEWEDVSVGTPGVGVLPQGAGPGFPAACSSPRRALPSSGSTSTPVSLGPPTTGWAWRRRLSSHLTRYLARDLGPEKIRVNLVAAGPVRTVAAKIDKRVLDVRGHLGDPGPARMGRERRGPRCSSLRSPHVRLVPDDHGRDSPRGRRSSRSRSLRQPGPSSSPWESTATVGLVPPGEQDHQSGPAEGRHLLQT